jgi:hypothetical protein
MHHLEVSGAVVLYIGCTVSKGYSTTTSLFPLPITLLVANAFGTWYCIVK